MVDLFDQFSSSFICLCCVGLFHDVITGWLDPIAGVARKQPAGLDDPRLFWAGLAGLLVVLALPGLGFALGRLAPGPLPDGQVGVMDLGVLLAALMFSSGASPPPPMSAAPQSGGGLVWMWRPSLEPRRLPASGDACRALLSGDTPAVAAIVTADLRRLHGEVCARRLSEGIVVEPRLFQT